MISGKLQLHLSLLAFRFLQTENIRIQLMKAFLKALGDTGPDPIYIPGNKFHIFIFSPHFFVIFLLYLTLSD